MWFNLTPPPPRLLGLNAVSKRKCHHYFHHQISSSLSSPSSQKHHNHRHHHHHHHQHYYNKRMSQQPALGALTFSRSFVASKANFCSHLLASLVHFTVVKSQAVLFLGSQKLFILRLGVAEVISAVTLYLLPASKRQNFYLVGYARHNNFACGFCLSIVTLTATMCLYNVSRGDELTLEALNFCSLTDCQKLWHNCSLFVNTYFDTN